MPHSCAGKLPILAGTKLAKLRYNGATANIANRAVVEPNIFSMKDLRQNQCHLAILGLETNLYVLKSSCYSNVAINRASIEHKTGGFPSRLRDFVPDTGHPAGPTQRRRF